MTAPFQVMPPLSPEEYAELREDIRKHGITVPIVFDRQDRVVDGHHRMQIAEELGLDTDDVPWVMAPVETDEELRDLAYRLNAHRRHLSREQKRAALELSLKADPALSDRQHAERVGVSDKTAGAVRRGLEERAEIPHVEERTDSTGRQQPATKPERPAVAVPDRIEPGAPLRPVEGRPLPDPFDVDAAVERYPDLDAWRDQPDRIESLATALDGYGETERATRLDALAKSAAARREGRLPEQARLVEAFAESAPDLRRARIRADFMRWLLHAHPFDVTPEEVALIVDADDEWDRLARRRADLDDYFARLLAARPRGLRVIGAQK